VSELPIAYAWVSTDEQDLTAHPDALAGLGAVPERIYVDHGLTGTMRARPGVREALAACRTGARELARFARARVSRRVARLIVCWS
jgi:DNA invertase Pin-like site-specific DNA recombinase